MTLTAFKPPSTAKNFHVCNYRLAHDIGNPPFGHAGEDAIRDWIQAHKTYLTPLASHHQRDVEYFEGNAQFFRLLPRSKATYEPG